MKVNLSPTQKDLSNFMSLNSPSIHQDDPSSTKKHGFGGPSNQDLAPEMIMF